MNIVGIIAEYNPFHNGHLYQIQQIKKAPDTFVIAVMSGHFVQRGGSACFSKWDRAKAAVLSGVDLVIELPTVFATASAEHFAKGGIYLLDHLGVVDSLCFGSECGEIFQLEQTAKACCEMENSPAVKGLLDTGVSYPSALQKAISQFYPKDIAAVLSRPNNTLGVEYIKALKAQNSTITPMTIKRKAVAHHSLITKENTASATKIRALMSEGNFEKALQFTPEKASESYENAIHANNVLLDPKKLELMILYKLRTMTKQELSELPDVIEGLENRIFECAKKTTGFDELLHSVKTKRYTLSRIRRIFYHALLGVTKNDLTDTPQYVKILAANQNGVMLLKKIKKNCDLPISPKVKTLEKIGFSQLDMDIKATDIFYLGTEEIKKSGLEFTTNPFIQKM